ncbi:MAG: DUF3014 domain-containing protein [Acidobacteriota bacterium]
MEEKKKVIFAGAAGICLIGLLVIIYFLFLAEKPSVPPVDLSAQDALSETVGGSDEGTLKSGPVEPLDIRLEGSDSAVRDLIRGLSADPVFAQWILGKDLILRFTAAVDNIAQGSSPRPHIDFFKVEKEFAVEWKNGAASIDPSNFSRYDVAVDVFSSLDVEDAAILFRRMMPVFQEAYAELGYPNKDFEQTLMKAVDELLKVPIPPDKVEVERDVITYTYKDPDLEKLSEAQKHLLRMGPDNIRIIQAKLKKLAAALWSIDN